MTRPLRILTLSHLYPSSAYPSSGPFVRDEVMGLSERHEIRVISPLRVPQRRLSLARQVLAVPKHSVEGGIPIARPRIVEPPLGGPRTAAWLWALRLDRILRRSYREMPADLLHAHYAFPDGFAAARFASRERAPLVITVRGSDVLVVGRGSAGRQVLRRTLTQADAVIAVSEELADRVEHLGIPRERIRVAPGGVAYEAAIDRESARRLVGIPEGETCIVWVGSFVPIKQPMDVVNALGMIENSVSERRARLVMIGDGPLSPTVGDLVDGASLSCSVRLVGRLAREEVWRWQCAADILVNSSSSEGTPIAVLEALGAGTPVVAYPLAGVRAVVDAVDGGTIATGKTPHDLGTAIGIELSTARDRTRLAAAARQRFDIARAVAAIEDVYASIV